MTIRPYDPKTDSLHTQELWQLTLGERYPLTERVFYGTSHARPNYEPGDGWVAEAHGRLVGYGMLELNRRADSLGDTAWLTAIVVAPEFQRRGIGSDLLTALEDVAKQAGCAFLRVGSGPYRLWSALPEDLPDARAFFVQRGYQPERECWDLVVPLGDYQSRVKYVHRLAEQDVVVEPATTADIGAAIAFEQEEFAGWVPSMLNMFAAGDTHNVLLVKHGDEIVGTIQTFTPKSRWRAANLVWEAIHGRDMGGYGAVGIAKAWQGRGLGGAMCEAAALHVERCGGQCCYIDWTTIIDFYEKLGAIPWRKFEHMALPLT